MVLVNELWSAGVRGWRDPGFVVYCCRDIVMLGRTAVFPLLKKQPTY